jgi:ribonuclease Z
LSKPSFTVQILGSGSATPTTYRNPSGQLIEFNNAYYLIDCGEGTQLQLRKINAKFQRINHVFVSHLHGDHFFGLIGLLNSMHLYGKKTKLTIFSPPELKEVIDLQLRVSKARLDYPIEYIDLQNKGFNLIGADDRLEFFSFPLKHRVPTCGFLLKEKPGLLKLKNEALAEYQVPLQERNKLKMGEDFISHEGKIIKNKHFTYPRENLRTYAYCSDTAYSPKTAEYVKEVDVLYHEATFENALADKAKDTMHSTTAQAAKVAKEANVKKLIIGHYSSRYRYVDKLLHEAREVFTNTIAADDGMIIRLD